MLRQTLDYLVSTSYNALAMIYYLVTKPHTYTVRSFLEFPKAEPLRNRVKIIPYEEFEISSAKPGVYIFSDIERLSDTERARLAKTYEFLSSTPGMVQTLNHPGRVWRRFELLRNLNEKGINDFTVHRLINTLFMLGFKPTRLPAFLRGENDHSGPLSSLIYSRKDLLSTAARYLFKSGGDIRNKIFTEFCDTSDKCHVFRKYSAFRIGDVIIPRHLFFSDHWAIKEARLSDKAMIDEEIGYIEQNPHRKELMSIFRMASIDYGRIDYGLKNGRIQVWEINTNPMLVSSVSYAIQERATVHERFADRVLKTFERLDSDIVIRKMHSDDAGGAIAILSKWNMAPVTPSSDKPDPERSAIEIGNSFVAVHKKRIIGVASYIMLSDTFAETASLAVDPQYRGDGIGYKLQAARLSEMHRRGVKLVRTETDRLETIEWYKARFGYRVVGRNKKKHEFSLSYVDEWTVLELDLDDYISREHPFNVSG